MKAAVREEYRLLTGIVEDGMLGGKMGKLKTDLYYFQEGSGIDISHGVSAMFAAVHRGYWPEKLRHSDGLSRGYLLAADLNECIDWLLWNYPDEFKKGTPVVMGGDKVDSSYYKRKK